MGEKTAEDFINDKLAAQEEVKNMQQRNIDKARALAAYGRAIDPAIVANRKIDTFVKTFLDENAKLVYLRNLETSLSELLDEALEQARQSKLILPKD